MAGDREAEKISLGKEGESWHQNFAMNSPAVPAVDRSSQEESA
jgi:hypothetical protein